MRQTDINSIADLIASLGFPMFVAIFMLVRNDKQLDEMRTTVDKNTSVMERLLDRLSGGDD